MALRYCLALWAITCLEALDEDSCADVATSMVQVSVTMQRKHTLDRLESTYWYPSRGVNDNRSGWSPAFAPFPLGAPKWQYEVPGLNFHQTPCIDDNLNVYSGSDSGTVLSFTKEGLKRWEVWPNTTHCQNPALYDGILYTTCHSGEVFALNMETGEKVWSHKYTDSLPGDTYTVSAGADYLVVPLGDVRSDFGGSWGVAVLERADGQVRWVYNMTEKTDGLGYTINMAPCLLDDSIIVSDTSGGIYRLSLKDGSEIWRVPGNSPGSFTLGGVACAEGMVFNGFSQDAKENSTGGLQALSAATGKPVWAIDVPRVIHNAPAVGRLWGSLKVGVVAGIGEPAGFPTPDPAFITGTVMAVDAMTGETIWTFDPPPWLHTGAAGSTNEQMCLPDLFSAATISGDGTVYINWSAGGITYALRDDNHDGKISLEDPDEVSAYDLGSGATGPPAIAPGMIFVNTCRRPSVEPGAYFRVQKASPPQQAVFRILRVVRYDTVHEGLRCEGVGSVLPGVTSLDAGLATFAQLYGQQ
ncbi:afsK, partial [Symbiodinium microadriaticum]